MNRILRAATTVRKVPTGSQGALPWATAEELSLDHWYGHKAGQPPRVRARLLYTDARIHAHFTVRETNILARHLAMQEEVYEDSCVELFISADGSNYINFEVNCIGTYLCYQCRPGRIFDTHPAGLPGTDFGVKTSLPPGRAIPAAVACPPGGYTVEFSMPFAFIEGVLGAAPPRAGSVWKANLFKCGENLPVPHWGSWAEIPPATVIDFHKPEHFGELRFE